MNNKKIISLFLLTILMSTFMIGFVQAAQAKDEGCNTGLTALASGETCARGLKCNTSLPKGDFVGTCVERIGIDLNLNENINKTLDASVSETSQLFDRALVFILIFVVLFGVFSSVNLFGKKKGWINFVIATIFGLIGIRYLSNELIRSLASPTSALTALIFAGFPFVAVWAITKNLAKKNIIEKGGKNNVSRGIWAAYALFLIIMSWNNWTNNANVTIIGVNMAFIVIGIGMILVQNGILAKKWAQGAIDTGRLLAKSERVRRLEIMLNEKLSQLTILSSKKGEGVLTPDEATKKGKLEADVKRIQASMKKKK